jgi:hypothetical protein
VLSGYVLLCQALKSNLIRHLDVYFDFLSCTFNPIALPLKLEDGLMPMWVTDAIIHGQVKRTVWEVDRWWSRHWSTCNNNRQAWMFFGDPDPFIRATPCVKHPDHQAPFPPTCLLLYQGIWTVFLHYKHWSLGAEQLICSLNGGCLLTWVLPVCVSHTHNTIPARLNQGLIWKFSKDICHILLSYPLISRLL